MTNMRSPNGPVRARRPIAGLFAALAVAATVSCSLLIEQRSQQCKTDDDCKSLNAAAVCQDGACVLGNGTSGTGATGGTGSGGSGGGTTTMCDQNGGIDKGGCWACEPTNDSQFLNHCTDAKCVKFDNKRVTKLPADGKLPPLP